MSTCMAPKNDNELGGPRCGEPASWVCPLGPRCDRHAQEEIAAIRDGSSAIALIAGTRGTSRETLVSKYRRIN